MKKIKSFTLIELLMVISIIATLAALLLPALKTAREKAKISACINNLRQMGIVFHLYAQDWDGKYPSQNWGGASYFNSQTQFQTILIPGYIPAENGRNLDGTVSNKNSNLFYCPAHYRYVGFYNQWASGGEYGYCYMGNVVSADSPSLGYYGPTGPASNSNLLLMQDNFDTDNFSTHVNHVESNQGTGANCLYNDGHVTWKMVSQLRNVSTPYPIHTWLFNLYDEK